MTSTHTTDRLRLYFYNIFQRENPMPPARVGFCKILDWERERSFFIRNSVERLGLLDDEVINDWLNRQK